MANSRESPLDNNKKFINRIGELSSTQHSTARSSTLNTVQTTSLATSQNGSTQSNLTGPNYAIHSTGGMPRSLNLNKLRRRREVNKEASKTDVSTQKVIQVVAPGDVAFSLPLSGAQDGPLADVVQQRLYHESGNIICLTTTSLAAGIVFVVLVLLCICITVFLVIRLRNMPLNSKNAVTYHCPKHPNAPCSCEVSLVQPQYYLQIPAVHLANIS